MMDLGHGFFNSAIYEWNPAPEDECPLKVEQDLVKRLKAQQSYHRKKKKDVGNDGQLKNKHDIVRKMRNFSAIIQQKECALSKAKFQQKINE